MLFQQGRNITLLSMNLFGLDNTDQIYQYFTLAFGSVNLTYEFILTPKMQT